jgi:Ni/Co efflux regulator RcnB
MTEFVVFFILFLTLVSIAFIAGWNLSVKKWRATRTQILSNLEKLEDQVNSFNEQRLLDPQRGWTDVGTQYALIKMESTIREVRSEIEDRKERAT